MNYAKLTPWIKKSSINALLPIVMMCASQTANATIVQFQTAFGNFEVNLYDDTTPQSVTNFLTYVNAENYSNSVIHRSVSNFIVQGGGFKYDTAWPVTSIAANAAISNEPVYSNVRGTISMAKVSGNANSATNQWFINLGDNGVGGAALDSQNSGFSVFGQVIGDGMAIVDQIAALPKFNLGGAWGEIPLQNYTSGDPDDTNLVIISRIEITDPIVNTATNLNRPLNTTPVPQPQPQPSSSGGGSASYLLLLGFVVLIRKVMKR